MTVFTAAQTTIALWSASGSSQSLVYSFQTDSTGGASTISSSANQAGGISMTALSVSQFLNFNYNTSLPPGEYMAFVLFSSTTAGLGAVASNLLYQTSLNFNNGNNTQYASSFGALVETNTPIIPGNGFYSAGTIGIPNPVNQSQIVYNNGARHYMIFAKT